MRASIDCAREMRGTSSSPNDVMPASRSARTVASSVEGEVRPIVTAPRRSRAGVAGSSGRTCSSTSRSPRPSGSTIVAPACSYAASACPDASPAPCSTSTSNPRSASWRTVSGVTATRRSPVLRSLAMPTLTGAPLTRECSGAVGAGESPCGGAAARLVSVPGAGVRAPRFARFRAERSAVLCVGGSVALDRRVIVRVCERFDAAERDRAREAQHGDAGRAERREPRRRAAGRGRGAPRRPPTS